MKVRLPPQHAELKDAWMRVYAENGTMEDVGKILGIDLMTVYTRKRQYERFRRNAVAAAKRASK